MVARDKTAQLKQQIIEAADRLFYQKGYNQTSFSDIAHASQVPRGNLNYHFANKHDVLLAVIEYRVVCMKEMLLCWESEFVKPLDRIKRYAQIVSNVKDEVVLYGCPMGTLNAELAKGQKDLQLITKQQFSVFENWLNKQFKLMGQTKKAAELTMHLMVRTQGISNMAYIHQNSRLIKREVELIVNWLDALAKEVK